MTRAEEMLRLAERVEAATGADREIDLAIYFAVECQPIPVEGVTFPWLSADVTIYPGTHDRWFLKDGAPTDGTLSPAYTASLDAALTLAPEGYSCNMGWNPSRRASCILWVGDATANNDADCSGVAFANGKDGLVLALCAAALRARAAMEAPHA